MSRVQLALNVANLDEAISFYSKLFRTEPAKVREGYANFAIAEPPLKLVLIAGDGVPGTMNHVGVEVENTEAVTEAIARFQAADMATDIQENTSCCFAVQDKVWVQGPDIAWEFYTVLGDAPSMALVAGECCGEATEAPSGETTSRDASSYADVVGTATSSALCC